MPELTSVQSVNPTSSLKEANQNTMNAPVGILRNKNTQQNKSVTTTFFDTSDSEQESSNQVEYNQEYETENESGMNPDEARETLQHENLIKSGYLNKKQERRKNWKRRWFVLRSTKLAYYKSEKEYELLKILDMNEVHTVTEVKLKNKQNVFGIVTSKRTYYVQASSKKELDEWVEAINDTKKVVQDIDDDDTGSQADSEDTSVRKRTPSTKRISNKSPLSESTQALDISLSTSPEKGTAAIDIPPKTQFHSSEHNAEGAVSSSYTSVGSIPNITSSSPSSPITVQFPPERKDSSDPTASSEEEEEDNVIDDEIDVVHDNHDDRTIRQGIVYKLDRYKKIWKKRVFVLKSDQLLYYKNKDFNKPLLKMNLADILDVIETDPVSKTKQYCFKVITPKRTYICCVNSEESQVAWMAALKVALGKTKK